ncbi:glycerate kinase type-2 family protein [Sinorhizobium fredii]|uniref:glycerate kinase type-2 family protein n=1 Tax=Rhizobium fredii TaxID=380 RepID=UPI0005956A9A|nr:glycerate kinase [Sinorhizobium fredii]WOS66185.1 glycerate kinase [Sinorhizobium fredii GR64]
MQASTFPRSAARALLLDLFRAAVKSADPLRVLPQHLPDKPSGRCVVVGAGKSAAVMAKAVEAAWPDVDLSGCVVTRHGHAVATEQIAVIEAGHPVPDAASFEAARRIMASVRSLREGDLVLALISGGGSSLLAMPAEGLSENDKQIVNRLLLASGLGIAEMNAIRRRLSAIKGGRLAEAARPARVVTLAISDIPGDDPLAIASGPTVYDPYRHLELSYLAERLGPALPQAAKRLLCCPAIGEAPWEADFRLIATPMMTLEAAASAATRAGVKPMILGDALEGEAREVGKLMAGIARSVRLHGHPAPPPVVLLSGGETTVSLSGPKGGLGGRNTEFLLSLAIALDGDPCIYALAGDTDGIDGNAEAAGAIITPDTIRRAGTAEDAKRLLDKHDSYGFFERLGDLVVTGPTLTNVNDFRAVLVLP